MKYELLIFDWDGTLMDSESKIVNCFQAACVDVGVGAIEAHKVKHIIGLGLMESVQTLFPQLQEQTWKELVEAYRQHFLVSDQTAMDFFPGVLDGLGEMEQAGYLLAVATGKARRGLNRVLDQWDLHHRFVATRCSDEAYSKPHPKMLEDILEYTGLHADQAVMIGDTHYDMEMAQAIGMDRIAVSYGVHSEVLLWKYQPIECFDEFGKLKNWLLVK